MPVVPPGLSTTSPSLGLFPPPGVRGCTQGLGSPNPLPPCLQAWARRPGPRSTMLEPRGLASRQEQYRARDTAALPRVAPIPVSSPEPWAGTGWRRETEARSQEGKNMGPSVPALPSPNQRRTQASGLPAPRLRPCSPPTTADGTQASGRGRGRAGPPLRRAGRDNVLHPRGDPHSLPHCLARGGGDPPSSRRVPLPPRGPAPQPGRGTGVTHPAMAALPGPAAAGGRGESP